MIWVFGVGLGFGHGLWGWFCCVICCLDECTPQPFNKCGSGEVGGVGLVGTRRTTEPALAPAQVEASGRADGPRLLANSALCLPVGWLA